MNYSYEELRKIDVIIAKELNWRGIHTDERGYVWGTPIHDTVESMVPFYSSEYDDVFLLVEELVETDDDIEFQLYSDYSAGHEASFPYHAHFRDNVKAINMTKRQRLKDLTIAKTIPLAISLAFLKFRGISVNI